VPYGRIFPAESIVETTNATALGSGLTVTSIPAGQNRLERRFGLQHNVQLRDKYLLAAASLFLLQNLL